MVYPLMEKNVSSLQIHLAGDVNGCSGTVPNEMWLLMMMMVMILMGDNQRLALHIHTTWHNNNNRWDGMGQ